MSILPGKRMSAVESPPKERRTRQREARPDAVSAPAALSRVPLRRSVLLSLAGAAILWAAFPPLGWSLLAWVAPIPWLILVREQSWDVHRPYRMLWMAGFIHWLAVLQGVRLAHWATYLGWVVLAAYLAFYLPAFVALTRAAVHRLRVPLAVAAPLIWVGLEYVRGYFATGFSLALLGHTQVRWLPLIQIADLFGAYGVSFVVMFVAACLTCCLPAAHCSESPNPKPWRWRPLVPLAAILAAAWGYGSFRMSQPATVAEQPALRTALVQAWVDTIFEYSPERDVETFETYADLSRQAIAANPELDVIIWPEWVFTDVRPLVIRDAEIAPPPGVDWPENVAEYLDDAAGRFHNKSQRLARQLGGTSALLVGVSVHHYGSQGIDQYNSAVHLSPTGEVVHRYDKMHPVMFGEYVPLGEWLPSLYRLTPLSGGLSRGKQAEAFEISGLRLAPSVCFESTVPHLIRRHVAELEQRGEKPDVLVNLTNDGWFWGSSILDLHLTCGVFRAVEHRTPMLIAANTGLSAWVDGNGRVRNQGERFNKSIVLAEVRADPRSSFYTRWGDWAAGACLAFCGVAAVAPLWSRFRARRARPQ